MSDKIHSSLLGAVIGDIYAGPLEFLSPEEAKTQYGELREIVGGGWLSLEVGQWTDDSETAIAVCKSLIRSNGYNQIDLANAMVEFWESDPIDIGNATRAGIFHYIKTGIPVMPPRETQGGNGALTRSIGFILAGLGADQAVEHAHLSHNHPASDDAIRFYHKIITGALSGRGKADLLALCETEWWPSYPHSPFQMGGYSVNSLHTALESFFRTDSFEDGMVLCGMAAGDADTNCFIYGGLAGAYYGFDSIPARWLEALDQAVLHELVVLADGLMEVGK
jgi:ADP-ribosyl-[dinitrogen reductase] hydrolase